MIGQRAFLFSLAVVCLRCFGAEKYAIDWRKTAPEILEKYRDLIRIDTSNPPGNETKAADHIKAVLEREGFRTNSFALDAARANLVTRLKGNARKRPLLLMGQTDVVGVQRGKWTVDPFSTAQ